MSDAEDGKGLAGKRVIAREERKVEMTDRDARLSVICEAVGQASMCWDVTPMGVFDSARAERVATDLYALLSHMGFPNHQPTFREGLRHIINCHSMENGSDTPDFMLADYLVGCLELYDKTLLARDKWMSRPRWTPGQMLDPTQAPQPASVPMDSADAASKGA